jgi:hypothetical protein
LEGTFSKKCVIDFCCDSEMVMGDDVGFVSTKFRFPKYTRLERLSFHFIFTSVNKIIISNKRRKKRKEKKEK